MTANEARTIAFDKVGTTYDEGLKNILSYIDKRIKEEANKAELTVSFYINDLVEAYIRIKSKSLENTIGEYLKKHYEELGFEVSTYRYNVSPDFHLRINW